MHFGYLIAIFRKTILIFIIYYQTFFTRPSLMASHIANICFNVYNLLWLHIIWSILALNGKLFAPMYNYILHAAYWIIWWRSRGRVCHGNTIRPIAYTATQIFNDIELLIQRLQSLTAILIGYKILCFTKIYICQNTNLLLIDSKCYMIYLMFKRAHCS